MQCCSNPRGSLQFELWGIPIFIRPSSWVVLALLGGGLGINSGADVSHVLIFVVAGMLCLLVHELGHALVGRALGSGAPSIEIAGMGGVTYTPYPPRTKWGYFMMVLAGPLSSLFLGIFAGFIMGLLYMGNPLAGIVVSLMAPLNADLPDWVLLPWIETLQTEALSPFLLDCYFSLFIVCVYWSLFNLLPLLPLDGGKLLGTLLNNYRIAAIVGLIVAGGLSLLCLASGMWFNMVITGYLAFINWQYLRSFHKE